jgi:hypothetical protein
MNTITGRKNLSARDSSTSTASSSSSGGNHRKHNTEAHDAIVNEVVRRSIAERKFSKLRAFREVSDQLRARNVKAIPKNVFDNRFNNIAAKCMKSPSDSRSREISSGNRLLRKKCTLLMNPETEKVLQLILRENTHPLSSDRVYEALRTKLAGHKHIPTFRQVQDWIRNKLRCTRSVGTARSEEVDPLCGEVISVLKDGETDITGGSETSISHGDENDAGGSRGIVE